jgi:hypothetical protein
MRQLRLFFREQLLEDLPLGVVRSFLEQTPEALDVELNDI